MVHKIPPMSSITTDELRDFVQTVWRDRDKRRLAEKRKLVIAVLDAYDHASRRKKIAKSELAAITSAACSKSRPVWIIGTDLLMRAACRFDEGREAIRRILTSGPANERFPGWLNSDYG